jgi:hypothetical protein
MSSPGINLGTNLGTQIYEGSAEFGVFKTKIVYYIAIGIVAILLLVGIKLYTSDQSDLIDTNATVIEVLDKQTNTRTDPKTKAISYTYTYSLNIKFIADKSLNKPTVTKIITYTSQIPIVTGQTISITYSKSNPNNVTEPVMRNKKLALILSAISIIIIAVAGFNYWLTRKSKFYAAAQGVGTLANIISMPFTK